MSSGLVVGIGKRFYSSPECIIYLKDYILWYIQAELDYGIGVEWIGVIS
jgi:hypothetical protein